MKLQLSILFILLAGFVFVNAQGVGQTNRAIAYNDMIVEEQNSIALRVSKFMDHITIPNEPEAQNALTAFQEQTDLAVRNVQRMEPFEGNASLRDAALELFKFYNKVSKDYYPDILKVIFNANPTKEEQQRLNTVLSMMAEEEQLMDKRFKDAQAAFARKYEFKLGSNEIQEE